ncbi:hypothetical protein DV738_g3819, partial [Chaetothyriales sp. CBS 135597]
MPSRCPASDGHFERPLLTSTTVEASDPRMLTTTISSMSSSRQNSPGASPPWRALSRSMPATPSKSPLNGALPKRSPSVNRPRQPHSSRPDLNQTPTALRKAPVGCQYETGMAQARRRMPYSMGTEQLGPDPSQLERQLSTELEQALSEDITRLYEKLLPTPESEERRAKFVQKLHNILHDRWPSAALKVNVFGSTGNNLGTLDSDIDVCVTTDSAEMTRVCSIADLLAKNGMERVVCVSSAKVPIVKLWDPVLQVACDLNVNNTIALENTAMVKSYVDIDPRVRPLAMIIKYWAKRRILNDAALGGTLSSYAWICLTLNFLQTRSPPILPSLQDQPELQPHMLGGVNVSFDKNIEAYREFGSANHASLGQLLFQFFRYYAFEFDYEHSVVSVRKASVLSKEEKSWHRLQDNRLCIEEPFNISRNLANTADDTSMRGIHLELRRAFSLLADGQLDQCCEQYEYPVEEPKPSADFVPPTSRPVIAQAPPAPSRTGKTSSRGGRTPHLGRSNGSNSRRSSNAASRTQPLYLRNLPFQMTTQELQLQAQHQQHLLHDQLFQQYQYLQLQEQELRARLSQQQQRGTLLSAYQPPHSALYPSHDEAAASPLNGSFSVMNRPAMSAPLYQQRFAASPYLHSELPVNGISTNPSSPHLSSAYPDTRRFARRTSLTASTTGPSLRAQSQPARTLHLPITANSSLPRGNLSDYLSGRRSSASSNTNETGSFVSPGAIAGQSYFELNRRPAEYVGYYVNQSPSMGPYVQSTNISPIPSQVGLAILNGGLSPRSSAVSSWGSASSATLPQSEFQAGHGRAGEMRSEPYGRGSETINGKSAGARRRSARPSPPPITLRPDQVSLGAKAEADDALTFSASTSEDLAFDTPSGSEDYFPEPKESRAEANPTAEGSAVDRSSALAAESMANGHIDTAPTDEGSKPSLLPYPLGRQLPAVQEVQTITSGAQGKPSLEGRATVDLDRDAGSETRHNLAIRPLPVQNYGANGETKQSSGLDLNSTSSWQVPKSKRRPKTKTVKSEYGGAVVNVEVRAAMGAGYEEQDEWPAEKQRREQHHEAEVVIVGAGILGSALAVALGQQGRSVILLEKSLKEPDRIVGELLQPGGVQALADLGLSDCLEDIDAIRVKGYAVPLFEGRSFHHGRFVSKLRARALAEPNVTVFEAEATSAIVASPGDSKEQLVLGVRAITRKKGEGGDDDADASSRQADYFFGDLTIAADGYASKFRKAYSSLAPQAKSRFWGLELRDCTLPYPEHGLVSLTDQAPVLFYQIGTHETRVLVDVPDTTPTASVAAGGVRAHLKKVVLPRLPAQTQDAFLAALEKNNGGDLRSMPNSFLPAIRNTTAGLVLLGDALNMRHPLTGGGMTVALNDVVLLSRLLAPTAVPDLFDTVRVRKQLAVFHWQRKQHAAVINILAQALYALFAATGDTELACLQRGCFAYFRLGGICIDGPVGLLSGIIRQPAVLFYHFFAVALLSIWLLFRDNGLWRLPVSIVQAIQVFAKACVVIFPYIFAELTT